MEILLTVTEGQTNSAHMRVMQYKNILHGLNLVSLAVKWAKLPNFKRKKAIYAFTHLCQHYHILFFLFMFWELKRTVLMIC